jgi:hypothetical protein
MSALRFFFGGARFGVLHHQTPGDPAGAPSLSEQGLCATEYSQEETV